MTQKKNKLKYTINKLLIGELYGSQSGKYGAQDNQVHKAVTGHDVTHRYKEKHNDQKSQISYFA